MSTRDDRRAAAREGILAAAHRQVAEGGCASASVAAVAGRAGVAAGSLYRHFPSRADLLAEVVGSALRAEHLQLADAAREAGAPRAALSAWVRVATERALGAPRLFTALLVEPAEAAVEAARARELRAQEATLAALVAEGARAGAWPAADAARQAAALTGALQAALVGPGAATRLGRRPDAGPEADGLVAFALGALGAR